MLFNSLTFLAFFAIVFTLNQRLSHPNQNKMLLLASYIFYGWWDYRFLALILLSTVVDFYCGRYIASAQTQQKRKIGLGVSLFVNLGCLGFFKYFNFFADSLIELFEIFGFHPDPVTLNIILPVGISFYTFQTLSYTIDIYRRELKPTNNFIDFTLYVSFFPQLVAGPIERARTLLPQIQSARRISYDDLLCGLSLISIGFVKKLVIADRCGPIVNSAFNGPSLSGGGADSWVFLYLFAFQIYGDFSGYSDIARGTSRLLGFNLMRNFRAPYLVSSPSEFWRHWHISLSTWIRDYIYIPLGGNKTGAVVTSRNLLITMFLGGLWHGAGWAYILWGIYHGMLLVIYRVVSELNFCARMASVTKPIPMKIKSMVNIAVFFHLTCIGWLLFRTGSLGSDYSQVEFLTSAVLLLTSTPQFSLLEPLMRLLILMAALVWIIQIVSIDLEERVEETPLYGSFITAGGAALVVLFGVFNGAEFIYFQF